MDQVRTSPRTMIIALLAAIALTVATWLAMTALPGVGGDSAGANWNRPATHAGANWNSAARITAGANWNSVVSSTNGANWN